MMARLFLLCLILAMADVFVMQVMSLEQQPTELKKPSMVTSEISEPPAPASMEQGNEQGSEQAEAPDIRRLGKHHSSNDSIAGGGVIIGGLATITFAAIFCYIRVTRRKNDEK
ncbi:uncharacterized protein LOC122066880 [Macadamia integrifolia]|uniref:uncharacterized protein LOC122066880 n=1 Tax=Macadamia integrifolia TaxID=60698 RepID=UPI001C4FB00A|nr:uncharacterized protein LOC122066880 [Macadamia integrifolia]